MPIVKEKPTARKSSAKAKGRAKKTAKYGHYESYETYSENILVKPMRQLFGLLKDRKERGKD